MSMIPKGEDGLIHNSKSSLSDLVAELLSEFDIEIEISMDEILVKSDHENVGEPVCPLCQHDLPWNCLNASNSFESLLQIQTAKPVGLKA